MNHLLPFATHSYRLKAFFLREYSYPYSSFSPSLPPSFPLSLSSSLHCNLTPSCFSSFIFLYKLVVLVFNFLQFSCCIWVFLLLFWVISSPPLPPFLLIGLISSIIFFYLPFRFCFSLSLLTSVSSAFNYFFFHVFFSPPVKKKRKKKRCQGDVNWDVAWKFTRFHNHPRHSSRQEQCQASRHHTSFITRQSVSQSVSQSVITWKSSRHHLRHLERKWLAS